MYPKACGRARKVQLTCYTDALMGIVPDRRKKCAYVLQRLFMPILITGIVVGSNRLSYAQSVTCSLSAPLGPSTIATATGLTEPIAAGSNALPPTAGGGTVRITCNNSGTTFTAGVGILTISLGTPITNTTSHPFTAAAIRV